MSVLSNMRDTLSNLSLEVRLRSVRDQQIKRILAADPMTAEELAEAERAVILEVARLMYCDETARAMGLVVDSSSGRYEHRQDYAQRATQAADWAVLLAHRSICRIPVVGDPEIAPQ